MRHDFKIIRIEEKKRKACTGVWQILLHANYLELFACLSECCDVANWRLWA